MSPESGGHRLPGSVLGGVIAAAGALWVAGKIGAALISGLGLLLPSLSTLALALAGRLVWVELVLSRWRTELRKRGYTPYSHNRFWRYDVTATDGRFRLGATGGPGMARLAMGGEELPATMRATRRRRSPLGKLFGGAEEIATGDAAFDADFEITGEAEEVHAHLDAPGRRAIRALLRNEGERGFLGDGEVGYDRPRQLFTRDGFTEGIRRLRQLAATLATGGRTRRAALADSALSDPVEGVRLECLHALLTGHPSSPEAERAAHGTLRIPGDAARLEAARYLGPVAVEALLDLVSRSEVSISVRVEALDSLLGAPVRGQEALLGRALEVAFGSGQPALQGRAVAAAGSLAWAGLRPHLERLGAGADDTLAVGCAQALGAIGDADAEAALMVLLKRRSAPVQVAACEALGTMGSVRSVEHLLPLTRGLLRSGDLKAAATMAVDRIQARAGDAAGGRLSLVDPQAMAGEVSLVDGGEVSFVEEDA